MIASFIDKKIVLASASPRRLELLQQIGVEPLVNPVEAVEDQRLKGRRPALLVQTNARRKARAAAASEQFPGSIIIGADTVVMLGRRLFGKPGNTEEAAAMLRALSGQQHSVYTGICLVDTDHSRSVCNSSRTLVRFSALSEKDIALYVATGEPLDKAGAYGIQGKGGLFVESLHGDYGTVMGLSLPLLVRLASELEQLCCK
ncbi:MAG: Maf family nucleotide pyrophosphatase [Firmicutes bacterium]|nr:Maf family nucleotide pyrophosphatase [Bacillota bacterium]